MKNFVSGGLPIRSALRVKSAVKSGAISHNHNQAAGMRVKSTVKSGALTHNHNQTIDR